jgi:uncharacterized membrane protein HdeD (DUF308 family)
MAEPNWHKQVAIGTWILIGLTVILIALAVLSYVHPADPSHPMSLDFLSHSITVSPWLAVACLIAVIAITRGVVRSMTLKALQNRKARIWQRGWHGVYRTLHAHQRRIPETRPTNRGAQECPC